MFGPYSVLEGSCDVDSIMHLVIRLSFPIHGLKLRDCAVFVYMLCLSCVPY